MNRHAFSNLQLANVSVMLGGNGIVDNASATMHAGECIALIGPNGAGKTTLLRAIAGLIPATGRIALDGKDIAAHTPRQRAQKIGYLPQGHQTHWPLPARDIVALGRYPHGLSDPARPSEADAAMIDDALRRTDASAFASRNVQTLSGGERARIMIARVLATAAPIILADEPTAALDPRHQIAILQALQDETRRGALAIFVTHDLALASRFADRLMVMADGKIRADGHPANILSDEIMRNVYGVSAVRQTIEGQTIVLPWLPL